MRRKEREVTSPEAIASILDRGEICHLAMHGEPYPYVIPLHYGYMRDEKRFTLYFHCAHEGLKLDHIRQNPNVSFAITTYVNTYGEDDKACTYSARFESVAGCGVIDELQGDEKEKGLLALMRQVAPDKAFSFDARMMAMVTVLRLRVEEITGKQNRGPA